MKRGTSAWNWKNPIRRSGAFRSDSRQRARLRLRQFQSPIKALRALLRPFLGREAFLDRFQVLKAVRDHRFPHVLAGDHHRRNEKRRDVAVAIGNGVRHHDSFAPCEPYRNFRRSFRFDAERLVNRAGLRAVQDADNGGQVRVLARDENLTGKLVFLKRLDGAARGTVVGCDYGRYISLRCFQYLEGVNVSLLRSPIRGPGISNELYVAAVDERLQDSELALAEEPGVTIRG